MNDHFLDSTDGYKQPFKWSIIYSAHCGQLFRNLELDVYNRHCHLSSPATCLESLGCGDCSAFVCS